MTVKSEVQIYKKDGEDVAIGLERQYITVESVAQYSKMVVLHVDGVRYEVNGPDLQKAIANAQNC